MILIPQNAIMRDANFVAGVVIMHCSEQSLATVSDLMTLFIIMVRIAKQCCPAMPNLMPVFIIMVCSIREDTLSAE